MINLKSLLSEVVDFNKFAQSKTGLIKKYGTDELDAYTFGIEFEFAPSSTNNLDIDKLELRNDSNAMAGYIDWLNTSRKNLNRILHRVDNWDDTYGPIDLDTYDTLISSPVPEHYDEPDDFEDAMRSWESARQDVAHTYNYWERRNRYDYEDKYINDLITSGEWEKYVHRDAVSDKSSMDDDITYAMHYISDVLGEKVQLDDSTFDTWGVGRDGNNIEIRSKHLTQSEFDLVIKICDF